MGSSSVRRAMSNRTANEHFKSFVAIGEEESEMEKPETTLELGSRGRAGFWLRLCQSDGVKENVLV